jgi:16S rRNA (cytosine967-C5)-methyltransferase
LRNPRDARRAGVPETQVVGKISPARLAAFQVLERVASTEEHSDNLLHGRRLAGLSQADRNLATALVLGVLRWQIALDARIKPLLQRPEMKVPLAVQTALRMGAFQLLHMDRIPAHAALSESVELVRAAGQPQASGMVNAVLRALTRQQPVRKPLVESVAAVAERLGHPGWIVERWAALYGRLAAVAMCEFDQQEPSEPSLFVDALVEGLWIDDGSRMVAETTAASMDQPMRIWDCCAAPGGKTQVLGARHPGAEVLATDVSPGRLKGMAERLGPDSRVRTLVADASALPESEGNFDLILCDAPCSGTGTLGRNPEIRHRLKVSDLARQVERQRSLLASVAGRLKPGGRLVYSTCSLEPEENERVVEAVLAAGLPVRRVEVGPILDELGKRGMVGSEAKLDGLVRDGCLRTLPGVGFQGDGFFAAVLAKN